MQDPRPNHPTIWNLDRRCIWWVAHLGTSLLPGNSGLLWCAGNLDHPRIESGSSLFTSVWKNPGLSTINKYSESPRGTEPKFQTVSIATRQGWSNKRSRIFLLIHRLLPENSIEIEQTNKRTIVMSPVSSSPGSTSTLHSLSFRVKCIGLEVFSKCRCLCLGPAVKGCAMT